ncbi:MAG: hypothetical protein IJN77_08200 [Oscillospiraceae bacterium]|nr:hypothetical protein [Oscillospiraceae bacterium]
MEFIKISLIVFVCIILINCLPVYDKSVAAIVTIAACTVIMMTILNTVIPVIVNIKNLFSENINFDLGIIFKCMGISIITRFVADLATDNGNKALANRMIFAGKIAIIALALPLFSQVLEIIGKLIV